MGIGRPEKSTYYRRFAAVPLLLAAVGGSTFLGGCRTTEKDVQRWTSTAQGPIRLVAVVTHDKYPRALRTKAALALVTMPPREGQRVGVERLVEALRGLSAAERNQAVTTLMPHLLEGLAKMPREEGGSHVDDSVAYKDATYALLSAEGGSLIDDPDMTAEVKRALSSWVVADFEGRIDEQTQMFGVEQMMRSLGADGVRRLPELITTEGDNSDRIASLVAELGDPATRLRASKRLVARGDYMRSRRWVDTQAPLVREQNAKAKLAPTADQFKKQLSAYQDEQMLRLYTTMKRVGGAPVVDFLLDEAGTAPLDEKRRATALAALSGNLDRKNDSAIRRLLDLAGADATPDKVRDVALQRVGELPRALVIDRLYKLFDSNDWKVRWVAAELALKMSDQRHLDEFMGRLGQVKHMAITEPLRYGDLIGKLKGKQSPRALAEKYAAKRNPSAVRASALGFYFDNGKRGELGFLKNFTDDQEKVPRCPPDAQDCEWKCTVGGEVREVETIGDFVGYCVIPAVEARKQPRKIKKRSNKKE